VTHVSQFPAALPWFGMSIINEPWGPAIFQRPVILPISISLGVSPRPGFFFGHKRKETRHSVQYELLVGDQSVSFMRIV
jgi:hypothetical protein